jgi:hypothetical protein
VLGHRYDEIRDRLPDLLERYGDLRDANGVKRVLAGWRRRRLTGRKASERGHA